MGELVFDVAVSELVENIVVESKLVPVLGFFVEGLAVEVLVQGATRVKLLVNLRVEQPVVVGHKEGSLGQVSPRVLEDVLLRRSVRIAGVAEHLPRDQAD